MKLYNYVVLAAIVFVIGWGSLFFTILSQASRLNKLAVQNQQIALTTKSLTSQDKVLLQAIVQGNNGINMHINCVIDFFGLTPGTRNSSSITNVHDCTISPYTSGSSTSTTTQPSIAKPKSKVSSPVSEPEPTPQSQPTTPVIFRPLTSLVNALRGLL